MTMIVLPPTYYLTHFLDLLKVVTTYHAHLLESDHLEFIRQFYSLSEDAQALLVRIINRTGPIYDRNNFIYTEIADIPSAWKELLHQKFIRVLYEKDVELYIQRMKKEELKVQLLHANIPHKKSASRNELVQLLLQAKERVETHREDLILLSQDHVIRYILFLYFGKLQSKLMLPTLRDLGIRTSQKKSEIKAKFETLKDASDHYFYSLLIDKQKKSERAHSLQEIIGWPLTHKEETKGIRETLLARAAQEATSEYEALEILKLCTTYPSTAKKVRLLFQSGQINECKIELDRMLDYPSSDEELLFAEDFLQRKFHKKKVGLLTETLRNAEKISIDESFFRHPEYGVLEHFKERGARGHFSENFLWNDLFWLFFEDELNLNSHSEFDYAPPELVEKTFYTLHQEAIEQKLKRFSKEDFIQLIEGGENSKELLLDFTKASPLENIKTMLRLMSQDYYSRNSGFPDLMIIDDELTFYEIKAPGDSLKSSQLIQLRNLERAGYHVKILQVHYQFNENQTYIVVDLETTGTLTSYNRITEIGAIKVRNGIVIEKFQSLVNPERSIPQNIQALTGITNEMVKDAPLFRDLASAFQTFVGDAIFVAHNVSFDYGFIQNEYARLEERFVRPYICTKALMKKYYPGLDSYGLKNLCLHFGIPLVGHHRAMNDAEAAAELLKLINDKRKDLPKT